MLRLCCFKVMRYFSFSIGATLMEMPKAPMAEMAWDDAGFSLVSAA